jgi:hypothetical protein
MENLFHLNLTYSKKKLELLCFLLNWRSVGIKPLCSLERILYLLVADRLKALIGLYQLKLSSYLRVDIGADQLGLLMFFSLPKK